MRAKLLFKNCLYSISSYIFILILGLINRKVFVTFLCIEYLGYDGLFSNIFSILSLAEMGIGMVIVYNLYQEIAIQNKEEITKLMMMYKNIYRIVGSIIMIIGIILFPFLKFVINDNVTNWKYIQLIYSIQLIGIICSYFLAYRRILFVVSQMEYECIKIDVLINLVCQIARILILVFTKSYCVYLLVTIIQNVSANLIIAIKYNKTFSYAKKAKLLRSDFQKRNFFKDIPNIMVHKISYIIYGSVDNIVISAILGISTVGLFMNYILIKTQVLNVIIKLFTPMQATIGNLVYSEESMEKGKQIFSMFDLAGFFLASYTSITFGVLYQPFIELWLGKEYLLSLSFVFLLAFNIYIGTVQRILYCFRSSFGEFEKDRIYMILAAVLHLGLSILLVKKLGLSGVMLGANIGFMIIWFGRIKVVFYKYIKTSYKSYLIKQIKWTLLMLIEGLVTVGITGIIQVSITGLFLKFLICLLVPNIINLIIFYRTEEFKLFKIYIKQTVHILGK